MGRKRSVERLISAGRGRRSRPITGGRGEKSGARVPAVTRINPSRNVTICKNKARRGVERGSRFDISVGARPGCTGIAGRAKSGPCLRACVSPIKPAPSRGKVGGLPAGTKLISLSVFCRAAPCLYSAAVVGAVVGAVGAVGAGAAATTALATAIAHLCKLQFDRAHRFSRPLLPQLFPRSVA